MTNLLPPDAKKQIVIEYWTRLICSWVILWSVCMFIGVVLLWPTYVLLTGSNAVITKSAEIAIERTNEYDELSQLLTTASMNAQQIVALENNPVLSKLVEDIFNSIDTANIEITSISITRNQNEIQPISVNGIANDRISLAQLRDALQALPFVGAVNLPGDLAQNQDINFVLSITVIDEPL